MGAMKAMRPWLVDASAVVKLFHKEDGSEAVHALFARETWLESTWICVAETFRAIKKYWLRKEFGEGDPGADAYYEKVHRLQAYLRTGTIRLIDRERLEGQALLEARKITRRFLEEFKLDFSDAIQLVEMVSDPKGRYVLGSKPILVTADPGMLAAAAELKIETWNPGEDPLPDIR
jgi:hypothetical protein